MQDTGYTPTLSDIRQAWAYFQSESVSYTGSPGAEFNRWLNKIKAEVWDEGAFARAEAMDYFPENPYRTED